MTKSYFTNSLNDVGLQWKNVDCDLWVLRKKLEENSEEFSSVALLSPACFLIFLYFKVWCKLWWMLRTAHWSSVQDNLWWAYYQGLGIFLKHWFVQQSACVLFWKCDKRGVIFSLRWKISYLHWTMCPICIRQSVFISY